MSMPLNFKEGTFGPTIKKCVHGVFIPAGQGDRAPSCDGCNFGMSEEKQRERGIVNPATANSIE